MKCSHGSAIGRVDENALFYLRARGIDEAGGAGAAGARLRGGGARGAARARRSPRRSATPSPSCWGAVTASTSPTGRFDVAALRKQFPILARTQRGKPLVYLDTAATAQKPRAVIDAVVGLLREPATRASTAASTSCPRARRASTKARARSCAPSSAPARRARSSSSATPPRPSTWWRGAGAGATSAPGDEVIVTAMEHHANIVPWQMLCEEHGARLRVLPIRDDGELELDALPGLFTARTRIVAVTHVSNVLGTINPVREIVALAHARGVPVLVDGAQAAPRIPVDVRALGCDFYAVSGAQALRPERDRRALRPRRAARGDAAVAGRRLDDRVRELRQDHVRGRPDALRGGQPERRGRRRPRRRARLAGRHRHAARRAARARAARPRHAAARRDPGRPHLRARRRQDRRAVLHARGRARARRRAPCSTAKASRSARAITARSR